MPADFAAAAEVFKALAHATRAMVVAVLGRGERCVCELAEQAGCDMSTMSNHLTVLRHAGVVQSERRGSQVFYRLARPCVLDLLRCLGDCR
jgi:ArsR family transcriptional regulator